MNRTVAFQTLGCKVNQYDTEAMAGLFRKRGYRVVPFEESADVYVINSCTVTHQGDRKSKQLVRRARRLNPGAVVVVAGCFAQTSPGEAAGIPGVSLVLGNDRRTAVVDLVEEAERREEVVVAVGNIFQAREFEPLHIDRFGDRTRAALKIQDGCNEFCTYCIIPYARGAPRSRTVEETREDAARLAAAGFREVVLTGIHLGAYGQDLPGRPQLADVLYAIHELEGIERIRISSLEPMDCGTDLLDAMAALPKVCRHLHLPLQSGSNPVLKRMRRRYTTEEIRELLRQARRRMPEIALSTDVIAGFPGETEEQFEETCAFLAETEWMRLHVFPFSARKGTPAAALPDDVGPSERSRRVHRLLELGEELASRYHRRWLGRTVEVLIESGEEPPEEDLPAGVPDGPLLNGLTDTYVRVYIPLPAGTDPGLYRGETLPVRIEGVGSRSCWGRLAGAAAG